MEMIKREDLPAAVYAAAGAGDLAREKLRHLPETAARVRQSAERTAEQFRQRLVISPEPLRERVRASAERGTTAVITTAAHAQERVATGYRNLVSRGEKVLAERGVVDEEEPARVEVVVGPVESHRPNGDRPASGTAGEGGPTTG